MDKNYMIDVCIKIELVLYSVICVTIRRVVLIIVLKEGRQYLKKADDSTSSDLVNGHLRTVISNWNGNILISMEMRRYAINLFCL